MATYTIGSSGSEVKKLQEALNNKGYNLATDSIYGEKTAAAVKDYQKKNGLMVDGIAGSETLGSLYGSTKQQTQQQDTNTPAPTDYKDYTYDPGSNEAYQKALAALQQANAATPTYTPSYDKQLEDLYEKIVNREPFTYDLNADMLYDQYQAQYTRLGQQAMQDTMGQAAALTGGYGSTYAQGAGQQAYNEYLAQLNNIVPDLYNQAYGRYQDEGTAMQQQYAMLGDLADDEYAKYNDAYNRWLTSLQMARDDVDSAYDRGYNDYINAMQMAYQKDRDAVSDSQWEKEMAFQREQFDYQKQQDAAAKAAKAASKSNNSGSVGYDTEGIKAVQAQLNALGADLDVDGVWGKETQEAYEKYMGRAGITDQYQGYESNESGGKTSLSFSEDEGIFTWNGNNYGSLSALGAAIDHAKLTKSEKEELERKFNLYGFDISF